MDPREKILGLAKLMAKKGYDISNTMEMEAKSLHLLSCEISRPAIKGGNYSDGFKDWEKTQFWYDPDFGVIEIQIDGFGIVIERGHDPNPLGFKQRGLGDESERFEGVFKIRVMDDGADLFDDGEVYIDRVFHRKEGKK